MNAPFPKDWSSLRSVHIVGVGGTLMGAFAAFLKRKGIKVSGSDGPIYPPMSDVLKNAGVTLYEGYRPENLTAGGGKPDLVVIGNVIRSDNPEAQAAIQGGYAYTSLPQAMEELLLQNTRNLVVAGTHGKTTTSSLLAHVLNKTGREPSFFIGGVSLDLPHSFHVSDRASSYFVLEGDEYDTAFWDKVPKFNHYRPVDAILTSVEFDHADIYADFAAVKKAFVGLISRIQSHGRLIACWDSEAVRDLSKDARVPVISYGVDQKSGAQYWLGKISNQDGKMWVDFCSAQTTAERVELQMTGRHNALNALAVWIECLSLGLTTDEIREGLKTFRGVKRRQEVRGEARGVMVIDDFAHHPTAVRETLAALKLKYPGRRLTAVFEPRSATSRRKIFQQEYVTAFLEADQIYVAQPYDQSRIPQADQFSSDELTHDLKSHKKNAATFVDVPVGVSLVASQAHDGDLIAVLSNGGFGGFISLLLKELAGSPAKG